MKLNIIINGFESDWGARISEEMLRPFQIGYCLVFCREENIPNIPADEFHWHSLHEFNKIDWNSIRPVDEELIEKMRNSEAVMMELMSRHERGGRIRSYQERKRWYLMHLRYWNHILEEKKINLFLCNHIPHHDRTFMLYSLCKLKNIPVLFFHCGPVPDRLFLHTDWEKSASGLQDYYKKLHAQYTQNDEPIPLSSRFEEWYQAQLSKKDPVPWFMFERWSQTRTEWLQMIWQMLLRKPVSFVIHALRFVFRPFSPAYWHKRKRIRREVEAFRFYDAHAVAPDLDRRFIYVALHMQPECSTCPMGGAFVDQLLMVQLLAAYIPADVLLYIKEHPNQESRWRRVDFYKDLIAIPSVRLVPRNFSTFRLMERATAVASVTGTVLHESLMREKPVFMFGHDFQQYAPGVFTVHTSDDCRKGMEKIFEEHFRPHLRDVRIFLKAVDDLSFTGAINTTYRLSSEEENRLSMAAAVQKEVKRLYPDA